MLIARSHSLIARRHSGSDASSGCMECMHLFSPGVSRATPALSASRCWLAAARAMGGARAASGSAASLAAFSAVAGFCFPQCFVELRPGEGRCRRLPGCPGLSPGWYSLLRLRLSGQLCAVPSVGLSSDQEGGGTVGRPRSSWLDGAPTMLDGSQTAPCSVAEVAAISAEHCASKWEGVAP